MNRVNIETVLKFVGLHFSNQMLLGAELDRLDEFLGRARTLFECIREEHGLKQGLGLHRDSISKYQVLRTRSQAVFEELQAWVQGQGW